MDGDGCRVTLESLLQDIPYTVLQTGGGLSQEISSITIDSRKITVGGLFICLLGLTVDGHKYIDDVASKGAGAVLVELPNNLPLWPENSGRVHPRPPDYNPAAKISYPEGITVIQVENTRKSMAYIASNAHGRPAGKLKLIGVTGTNGKSTTTHFIEDILLGSGYKTGLIGTNGARVGHAPIDIPFSTSTTPDPLELHEIFAHMLENGVEYVIMEVSSHALAFYKMEGLLFEVGVFTNLTQDHLDLHGTMDNYRLAKAQLFAQSRFAVVNADDESTEMMLRYHGSDPYVTYGIDNDAELKALHIEYLDDGVAFDILTNDAKPPAKQRIGAPIIDARYRLRRATGRSSPKQHRITIKAKARFNVYNALAAIGTCRHLGLSMTQICRANIRGVPGRVQDVPNKLGVHVLVDYAHTPDGIKNVISSVREFTSGRVIIIFGCGGDRDSLKRPDMGSIAGELADYCIITSDNPRTECPEKIISQIEEGVKPTNVQYEICENRRDAIFAGIRMLNPKDALIIAGKGHEDYQIIGKETRYFSDYETALEALSYKEGICD